MVPSHVTKSQSDVASMIAVAHAAGFDVICATLIWPKTVNRKTFATMWAMDWDERWTVSGPPSGDWDTIGQEQVREIGSELWSQLCRACTS